MFAGPVSLDLWTPTRLIYTATGWRPVSGRGRRAGRRVCQQRVTSFTACPRGLISFGFDFAVVNPGHRRSPVHQPNDRQLYQPPAVAVRQQHYIVVAVPHRLGSRCFVQCRSAAGRRYSRPLRRRLMPHASRLLCRESSTSSRRHSTS